MESKKRNIPIMVVLAAVLALLPYAKLFFGAEMTYSGYSIANFINFFDDRAFWSLQTYGANALGRLFMAFPGGSTYIGIRAYCTFAISALNLILFFELIKEYHIFPIYLGLLISNFMMWAPSVKLDYYLSYFLLAATVLLLASGLKHGQRSRLFASGAMLGLCVFVRFSNVMGFLLVFPLLYYDFLCVKRIRSTVKDVCFSALGFFTGFAFVYTLTIITHGPDAFAKLVGSLRTISDAEYGYSISTMLMTFPSAIYKNYLWVLLVCGAIAVSIVLSYVDSSKKELNAISTFLSVFLSVFVLYVLFQMRFKDVFTTDYSEFKAVDIFVLSSLVLSTLFALIDMWSQRSNYMHKFLALIVLVFIFIIPLGDNTGMRSYQNAMILFYPLALGIAWDKMITRTSFRVSLFGIKNATQNYIGRIGIGAVMTVVTLFQSFFFFTNFSYGTPGIKELNAKISYGPLKGTYETRANANTIDGLSLYFTEEGLTGRDIITWGDIPLMTYGLECKSAFSTAWPDLDEFTETTFKRELATLDKPVIVINKHYSGGDPLNPAIWPYSEKAECLAKFIDEKGYDIRYENDVYRVYLAK